jgi:hypothetical protein
MKPPQETEKKAGRSACTLIKIWKVTLWQIKATIDRPKSHEPMTFKQKWALAQRRSSHMRPTKG